MVVLHLDFVAMKGVGSRAGALVAVMAIHAALVLLVLYAPDQPLRDVPAEPVRVRIMQEPPTPMTVTPAEAKAKVASLSPPLPVPPPIDLPLPVPAAPAPPLMAIPERRPPSAVVRPPRQPARQLTRQASPPAAAPSATAVPVPVPAIANAAATEAIRTNPTRVGGSCRTPEYPTASLGLGEAGTVVVQLLVGADGTVRRATVATSSGFKRLDEAAVQALGLCRFSPATAGGAPQEATTSIRYTFKP